MARIVRQLFSTSIARPSDVFEEPFAVFDLTSKEQNKVKVLEHDENILYVKSFVYKRQSFEIVFIRPNERPYSLFRSTSEATVKRVYETIKLNVNCIMKGIKGKENKKMGQLLAKATICAHQHPNWTCAHVAAHLGLTRLFSDEYADIVEAINSQCQPQKLTPLHVALQVPQNTETVKAILGLVPNTDLIDIEGNSVLHFAAMTSKPIFLMVWESCDSRRLISLKNEAGCSPVHLACYANRPQVVKELLRLGLTYRMMTVKPPKPSLPSQPRKRRGQKLGPRGQGRMKSNKKQKKQMEERTVDDEVHPLPPEVINELDEEDMRFGGNPLHWVRTRRTLDKLLSLGLKADAPNLAYERPIHVMVRRHKFRCLVGLLSHQYLSVHQKNIYREIALHVAVRHSDVSIVQALILFDSDIDAVNKQKESPRHLSAILKTPDNDLVLYALHSVNAKRCPPDMLECNEGCSTSGTFNGTSWDCLNPQFLTNN